MIKYILAVNAAALMASALSSPATVQVGYGFGPGYGMMPGYGYGPGVMTGRVMALALGWASPDAAGTR